MKNKKGRSRVPHGAVNHPEEKLCSPPGKDETSEKVADEKGTWPYPITLGGIGLFRVRVCACV